MFQAGLSPILFIFDFLNITLNWNTGIAFGLLSFNANTIYHLISALILLIIIYLIYLEKGIKTYFLLAILGGSLGNLFDRIYYNAVPDFMDLNYKGFHWFIFNVADIFISIGIICLIFAELLNYKKRNEI